MKNIIKMMLLAMVMLISANASEQLDIVDYKKAQGMYKASSAMFIDARGEKLFLKGTIPGSINIDPKKFSKMKKFLPNDKKAKIVTFCNGLKCKHSDELAELIMAEGYTRVMVYKGGYPEWKEKKQPLVGLLKEGEEKPKGPYQPDPKKLTTINGAEVYLGQDNTMIDQFWFAKVVQEGKIPANVQLVDVRAADQYKAGHIPGAINVSWDSKAEKIDATQFPKDKLVVFYCNTGMMSTDTIGSLSEADAKNALMFDANINCDKQPCVITPNENL